MIIYNVTINIDNSVQDEWLRWMKDKHIPDVLKTGLFTRNTILKVLGDEDSGGHTYSIQYTCASMDDFNRYEKRQICPCTFYHVLYEEQAHIRFHIY